MTTATAPLKPKKLRHRQLAEIHIIKSEIGLSDDDYRAMLQQMAGVDSSKDIDDYATMQAVIGRLRQLRTLYRRQPANVGTQLGKIKKLWSLLCNAGVINNPGPASLQRWAANQTGVNKLEWLRPDQCNQLIEALKSWCYREHVPYKKSPRQ